MNYVRNAWYVVSWADDLPKTPFAITVLGEPIVVWRSNDALVAFEDRCVHRLAPLSLGRCEGANLRCMYHGFVYEPSGRVVQIPGQPKVPAMAKVRAYPVVSRHGWVWVWMGDPARADEKLLPPADGFDDDTWIRGQRHLDYDAEARLINENLLDFSHISFVHARSLGAGMDYAETVPEVTALPRGVRFARWTVGKPFYRGTSKEPVDTSQIYEYHIPGVLLSRRGVFPPGTAAAHNHGAPDYSKAISDLTFSAQAVTPTGESTSRYFYGWAVHRDHGDEAKRDNMIATLEKAFAEDKVMIEAQQRILRMTPSPKVMPTVHDRGVALFNSLVQKLREEEDQAARSRDAA